MDKMYRVIFKGELNDVYLSFSEGDKLRRDLEEGTLEGYITLKGNTISTGAIKAIVLESSKEKEDHMANIDEIGREFEEWKRRRLKLTPKERAQSTAFFDYLSQAFRGRPLTEDEKNDVKIAQEQWFTEHPDFPRANPICYFDKDEISKLAYKTYKRLGSTQSLKDLLPANAALLAERVIRV